MYGQIMLGCIAVAEEGPVGPVQYDASELEDARWFTREDVARAIAYHYDGAPAEWQPLHRQRRPSVTGTAAVGAAVAATAPESNAATTDVGAAVASSPVSTPASDVGVVAASPVPTAAPLSLRVPPRIAVAHNLLVKWLQSGTH